MIKVLDITSANSPMGGTIGKIRLLAKESTSNHYIYFYCNKNNIDVARSENHWYVKNGVTVFYSSYGNNIVRHALSISKIIKKESIDVVNFYFHAETPVILILKFLFPRVKFVRSFVGYIRQSKFKTKVVAVSLKKCDGIIYISKYIKKCYEQDFAFLAKKKSRIIYNAPVNVTEESPNHKDRSMVTFVGGLTLIKNVPLLIEMMNYIVSQFHRTDIVLSIIGDGPDRPMIEGLIDKYNLSKQVHLLGYKKNISEYLQKTAVYVHSSTNEGFGISVVEAMYMRCPCIVADTSALPELLDENSGYVLSVARPDLWAEKLIYLYDNADVRDKMGEAAFHRAKTVFSQHNFVSKHDGFYVDLLNSNR